MKINNWIYRHEKLDSELLELNGSVYANLDFLLCSRYYHTCNFLNSYRNPSQKFQIAILNSMINIHDSWKTQIVRKEDIYDLKLWVFPSEVLRSSVALSQRDITLENESQLVASHNEFPFDRYSSLRDELNKFSWKGFFNDTVYFASDFGKAQYAGQRLVLSREEMLAKMHKLGAKREHVRFENGQRDIKYTMREDNNLIWIGTKS
ncbi:hypothetical protein LCGC14_2360230 [marine sediment metagenome]|uniref:Uncharacterized protein n=1 Tax=marine sediment metagenome TaxID=412755 RepID=A0A0F9C6N7_9ZZZZ